MTRNIFTSLKILGHWKCGLNYISISSYSDISMKQASLDDYVTVCIVSTNETLSKNGILPQNFLKLFNS